MSKILIKFIFLIFIFQIINAEIKDELFGDKSIIRKLRNELGSFQTEIKLSDISGKYHFFKEQYDFKLKSGTVNLPEINGFDVYGFSKWSYKDEFNLYFGIYHGECKTEINDNIIKNYLGWWTDLSTIQVPSKFKMLGHSHLLFSLIDNYAQNKENVNCESLKNNEIRCDIIFEEKYKFEYYFRNKYNLKMYPIRIDYLISESGRFIFRKRFEYIKFNYSFNGDYQINFPEIPIGYGCQISINKNNKIGTDLGEKFELEYDAELEYLDLETEDKDVFLKTQFKSQKWSMDNNFSFSFLDAKDEKSNKSIRTYLVGETKSTFEISGDKCNKYNFEDGENKKWINQLHNIKLLSDFFFVNDNKNSVWYLDDYKLDGKIYRVFEKKQYNAPKTKGKWYESRKPMYNIVTHYYSKSDNKVPELIEIRTRGFMGEPILATLKIKIKKHTLLSSVDAFEKIDLNQCE